MFYQECLNILVRKVIRWRYCPKTFKNNHLTLLFYNALKMRYLKFKTFVQYTLLLSGFILNLWACDSNKGRNSSKQRDSTVLLNAHKKMEFQKIIQSPQFKTWREDIKAEFPRFSSNQLKKKDKHSIRKYSVKTYSHKEWKQIQPYLIKSPNQKYAVTFNNYTNEKSKSRKEIKRESPDNEINLVRLDKQSKQRLLFTGPRTIINQTVWLNDSIIILTGKSDANLKNKMQPISWKININSDSITTYHYRIKDSL